MLLSLQKTVPTQSYYCSHNVIIPSWWTATVCLFCMGLSVLITRKCCIHLVQHLQSADKLVNAFHLKGIAACIRSIRKYMLFDFEWDKKQSQCCHCLCPIWSRLFCVQHRLIAWSSFDHSEDSMANTAVISKNHSSICHWVIMEMITKHLYRW